MNFNIISSFGPDSTPRLIRQLIALTCIVALLSATLQLIFEQLNLFPGPQIILSLSWWGLTKWYIWQPISYLFIQEANGLSLTFFITLLFNMYLLWMVGTSLLNIVGDGPFLRLYILSGVIAGIFTSCIAAMTGQFSMFAGATPSILALLTVWCMAFPEIEVYLFFLIPVKAKWIVTGLIAFFLLQALIGLHMIYTLLDLSAIACAYLYATCAWGWGTPFACTHKLDNSLAAFGVKMRKYPYLPEKWRPKASKKTSQGIKIVDIDTGMAITSDDAFVDAMLTKISKSGEHSLSWSEKRRLQQISLSKKH